MRCYPEQDDEFDQKELRRLNAEPWMVEQLKLNPSYPHWGPHEDYMSGGTGKQGWNSNIEAPTWKEFRNQKCEITGKAIKAWELDDLNVVANFYFQVNRASTACDACGESGYNPETRKIADAFYAHEGPGPRWCDDITQDEVDALCEQGRLIDFTSEWKQGEGWTKTKGNPTAAEVNKAQTVPSFGGGLRCHDAINRGILVETRAKRLGAWGLCESCDGHGSVYTEPSARLGLVLWVLHPRKGAQRGIEIKSVDRDDLPEVYAYLREAAKQNAERFAAVVAL